MAEATHTERYEPPRIEERTDISAALIGGLQINSVNVDGAQGS